MRNKNITQQEVSADTKLRNISAIRIYIFNSMKCDIQSEIVHCCNNTIADIRKIVVLMSITLNLI